MGELITLLVFLALGFGIGAWVERAHYQRIRARESVHGVLLTNLRLVPESWPVRHAQLVMGQAVISSDYFKTFAAYLRGLVGGEVRSLESLLDRARREATLRMVEEAKASGAAAIYNIRFETSNIARGTGGRRNAVVAAEVFAYGTALWLDAPRGPQG